MPTGPPLAALFPHAPAPSHPEYRTCRLLLNPPSLPALRPVAVGPLASALCCTPVASPRCSRLLRRRARRVTAPPVNAACGGFGSGYPADGREAGHSTFPWRTVPLRGRAPFWLRRAPVTVHPFARATLPVNGNCGSRCGGRAGATVNDRAPAIVSATMASSHAQHLPRSSRKVRYIPLLSFSKSLVRYHRYLHG